MIEVVHYCLSKNISKWLKWYFYCQIIIMLG